jgi:amino acid transporter
MNLPWFKRIGIFFIPKSFIGWVIMLAGILYAVYVFIDIDSRSHSASDTLRPFFLYLLIIGLIYTFVAFLTSARPKDRKDQPDK